MSETEKDIESNDENTDILTKFDLLGVDEGEGSYCCGKRMVLSSSGISHECLKCGGWEYSSS